MAMCSPCADAALPAPGFPIRKSTDQRLFNASPWLIAVVHVLHRLLVPRHPPYALDILTVIEPPRAESSSDSMKSNFFKNWPAVQFSRSGRGAICGDSTDGLSKLSSASCGGRSLVSVARPDSVDIPRTARRNRRRDLNGLPRKEVIQPHLPVRLPCYDFTPIMSPTFDGFLPEGWITGFGCCPLSWCDGRCVQGPGTYSPRRC